jgi:tricorn protease
MIPKICMVSLVLANAAALEAESRFFHDPDIGEDGIVFVHGERIWTAPLAGGDATRLTSFAGKAYSPRFSPDGSRIAFSSESGGNVDIYVSGREGASPQRLTYHPSADYVQGWTPDGRGILFSSDRVSDHFRPMLFTIEASGGHPEPLAMHKAFHGAFSPDGATLAYTPMRDAFRTWKRYRGGQTTPIWLVDLKDYSHVEVPHVNASDTFPVWFPGAIYFLSDRNGVMSLFRYDETSREVSEIHRNGETDIDSLAGSRGRLVFSSAGYVFLYDVERREARRLDISVPSHSEEIARGTRNVSGEIRRVVPSADGSQVAIEAHGEILVGSTGGSPIRNVTRSPGAADRGSAWSPDGRSLAFFSDAGGEYSLYATDLSKDAPPAPIAIAIDSPGLGYQLRWSPDGARVAFIDRFRKLWMVEILTGKTEKLDGDVDSEDTYAWSKDGRSIAYASFRPTLFRDLALYFLESRSSVTLTDGIGDAHKPAFSPDGSSLYFLGSTNAGKAKTGLDLSVLAHQNDVSWSVYAVNLEDRSIARLPVPASRYVDLQVSADGGLFLLEQPSEQRFAGEKPRLVRFDVATRKVDVFRPEVDVFEIAGRGDGILYRAGESWQLVSAAKAPETEESGRLDFSRLEVEIDPPLEWRQIFREAWRAQRDFFYDEKLHGVDWNAMRERYEAYLPDVRHRSDLNFVLRHLVGELVNSHISVSSPADPKPERVPVGLLGADYEVVEGRYRVKRVVEGSYWDDETSPLRAAGVDVEEGDFILEVDGQELRSPASIYSFFVEKVGKPVQLRVNSEPDVQGSRVVTVVPIASEGALRRRSWIERNRKKVDELSGGLIAYVYQPNTSEESLVEFDRYFFPQSDRPSVLVDERFNDGGGDPDYQLDILDRQQVHWYRNRNELPFKSPYYVVSGPKAMLVNAEAGSGGDVYPYQFTLRRLGTTIGTRTWGGVQGGGAGPQLIDGGFARVPNLGTWAPDGEYILENIGFTPDVEVEVFPADDFAGRDPQLERAVAILLDALRRKPPPAVPSLETVDRSRK